MNATVTELRHATAAAAPRGRVWVLPNRYGWLLLLILVVMLLGSMNYNNNLGYALTFLLLGVWVMALLHAWRNVRSLEIKGARAMPVFAGETVVFEIYLHNHDHQPRHALALRTARAGAAEFDIAAASTHSARLLLPTARRGFMRLPALRLSSNFPLGIGVAWMRWQGDASVLVYPHPAGALPLPLAPDPHVTTHLGPSPGNEDFAGLRDYRPGDSLRHIAWKTYARERGLHVKRFTGGGREQVHLRRFDLAFLGDTETQLSQMASWVLAAEQRGSPYSLELDDITIVAGSGEVHRDRCLQALALFNPPA